jgi:hypothetical protein
MTNPNKRNVFQQEPVWQIQITETTMEMVETRLEIGLVQPVTTKIFIIIQVPSKSSEV